MKTGTARRLVLAAFIVAAAAAFWGLGLGRYLTLGYLKASQARLSLLYAAHPLGVIASYMGIYILTAALSLPGAAALSLAGGALFGFWRGSVAVSFASTIGATLACFVSRYLLRDWVRARMGDRLKTVDRGMEREGVFYLFSLRLIPVFPFFVVNLVMGLTRMPLRTFGWISQVGMLPGTMVYVNAGKELARIDSLSGIISPRLLVSFALLGAFPIAARKLVDLYRNRREP